MRLLGLVLLMVALSFPAWANVDVVIDKTTQQMKVTVDDKLLYEWKVSTGGRGYDTPSGDYTATSMNEVWYSKQWDDAPMPHSIFFTKKGHAIHGSFEVKNLGRPVSHGCVRLHPDNATTLYKLVEKEGVDHTRIIVIGMLEQQAVPQYEPQPQPRYEPRYERRVDPRDFIQTIPFWFLRPPPPPPPPRYYYRRW